MKKDTNYKDDKGNKIFVGDRLLSLYGYSIIVYEDKDFYGKLVCDEDHACVNIPYALNKGHGYIKENVIDIDKDSILYKALSDKIWKEHKIGDTYTMDGKPELWKISYYPIFEDGRTKEVYNEPRALVEKPIVNGIDLREVPLRYLDKNIDNGIEDKIELS